jgi:hypothetical protein
MTRIAPQRHKKGKKYTIIRSHIFKQAALEHMVFHTQASHLRMFEETQ